MRAVRIKYHVAEKDLPHLPFPGSELQSLFRSAGIDMELIEADTISVDPAGSSRRPYSYWVERYGMEETDAGHLILALQPTEPDAAGQLIDLDRRGVRRTTTTSSWRLPSRWRATRSPMSHGTV